ncbi:YrdB family protein [Actinoallomurus rhizosphaericola]|uniref:YrdB family protein n=1 Tax=Actinoallomurus rhizosphaericola TaxID=2952536 RepID=UPI0020924390|nr:YrdB family protein [Actinoallomurus rhizosphaericola]MCO5996050.1 YrdB family protein [Actinoallomurus rhizosphaericola]
MIPRPLHAVNEGLAFLLELAALAVLAWWGAEAGDGVVLSVVLAVILPLVAAVVWGLFAAPRARIRLPLAGVLVVKVIVFGAAVAALYALHHGRSALVCAVIVILNLLIATMDRNALVRNRA